jgi:hypothetical protein
LLELLPLLLFRSCLCAGASQDNYKDNEQRYDDNRSGSGNGLCRGTCHDKGQYPHIYFHGCVPLRTIF